MFLAFGSLGCGIGYGYLHRIPTQPPSHHKKPPGGPPPSVPPPGAPPPGPAHQDSAAPLGLETGSKQGDYVEVRGQLGQEGSFMWADGPAAGKGGDWGCPHWEPVCGAPGKPPGLWDPGGADGASPGTVQPASVFLPLGSAGEGSARHRLSFSFHDWETEARGGQTFVLCLPESVGKLSQRLCLAQVPLSIRLVPGVCMRALGDYSLGMDYARGSQIGLLSRVGRGPQVHVGTSREAS